METARREPKVISANERRKLNVNLIGYNCDRDLTWGKYSILRKLLEGAQTHIKSAQTELFRNASSSTKFKELDQLGDVIDSVGKEMSVKLSAPVENKLLLAGTQFSTLIALTEENVPFTQRGQGSQRLLSMGLHFKAWANTGILLIDEIELGLEPSRIRSLINLLTNIAETKGTQIIITTHSPITLSECSANQIEVVRTGKDGLVESFNLGNCNDLFDIKYLIRLQPAALLCRRIIICEGETEVGIVRAIDKFLRKNKNFPMSYQGVDVISGRGDSTLNFAKHL